MSQELWLFLLAVVLLGEIALGFVLIFYVRPWIHRKVDELLPGKRGEEG